ncbi:chorismate-binding protein [Krasilnikoviella flava]|uniref:Para-aminobenzoate synthetase component 1 n=1 Tax=Krasilnikoviella flava TaxID=526729 RepID=A0A1T5L8S1_9MICO|nr:chorismate-binding protein [Krasilnikoviella flava]SKC72340.1 para-aminobenzoate synthetase component 1 [Krasilnikoviella flava]
MHEPTSWATFAGRRATRAVESVDLAEHPERLDSGLWFVVVDFEAGIGRDGATRPGGRARAWRFADVGPAPATNTAVGGWRGPAASVWTSSLDRDTYVRAVATVRERVRRGDVYQVNVCRVLSAPLATTAGAGAAVEPDAAALAARLAAGNPAPYAAAVHVPAASGLDPVWVVSASPELYLSLEVAPHGTASLGSGPIKGTARTPDGLTAKDRAENVMITDLVRNDLQRVCRPGTVEVTGLLGVEEHPGLVHLVSRVRGELLETGGSGRWGRVLEATFPPGSVSGAPKSSALRLIAELEPTARGPYCGAVGWVDGDAGRAELAVGIRTFWWTDEPGGGVLRFGTGAGITWGSDPAREWDETELKAARLVGLASTPDGVADLDR